MPKGTKKTSKDSKANSNAETYRRIAREAYDKQAERVVYHRKPKKRKDSKAGTEATGRESTYGGL